MVVSGIDVSKALLDVSVTEGPVRAPLRKQRPGPSPLTAEHGLCGGYAGGVRDHRRV